MSVLVAFVREGSADFFALLCVDGKLFLISRGSRKVCSATARICTRRNN